LTGHSSLVITVETLFNGNLATVSENKIKIWEGSSLVKKQGPATLFSEKCKKYNGFKIF
jgi:hypothetical protein